MGPDVEKKISLALGFVRVAYKDYIAARVLLNKGYTIQGAMFASTAIEKYFKAAIARLGGKMLYKHMDDFIKIKEEVCRLGYKVLFEKIDPVFLDILGKVYGLRYYDDIQEVTTVGFFRNQFLGELDSAVAIFEKLFIFSNRKTGEPELSPLKRDLQSRNSDLIENNWIALNIDKKTFMETDCEAFAIHILPTSVFEEIHVSSKPLTVPYNGTIALINMDSNQGVNR